MEATRQQSFRPETGRKRKIIYRVVICLLFLVAGVLFYYSRHIPYSPPEFDENAKDGVPDPEESFLVGEVGTDYGYSFSMAANLYQQADRSTYVYFSNPKSNKVNLMCEIIKADTDEVLYRSGVIKPGQYIEKLKPKGKFPNKAMDVTVRIYGFEPEEWYSAGTIDMSGILQAW